jgi:hypothetical protein
MSHRRRHVPLARRVISALVVSVWLLGLVGSVVHGSSHEHAYCSQHKAFEEVAGAASGTTTAAPIENNTWRATPAATAPQHETCAFADFGVRAPLADDFRLDVARPARPPLAPAPVLAHVSIQIPLLANAPKASPPSRSV